MGKYIANLSTRRTRRRDDYDEDVDHLEGDGVEDDDEKHRDENVGAEEESKESDGSDAVTEK